MNMQEIMEVPNEVHKKYNFYVFIAALVKHHGSFLKLYIIINLINI